MAARGIGVATTKTKNKMKIITLLLLIPTIASASLGSSESSCEAKYGKDCAKGVLRQMFVIPSSSGLAPQTIKGVSTYMTVGEYNKAGLKIEALFLRGKCVKITYSGSITPKLRTAIMNANGRSWKRGGMTSKWRTGSRVAVVSPSEISCHDFVFSRLEDKFKREVKKKEVNHVKEAFKRR